MVQTRDYYLPNYLLAIPIIILRSFSKSLEYGMETNIQGGLASFNISRTGNGQEIANTAEENWTIYPHMSQNDDETICRPKSISRLGHYSTSMGMQIEINIGLLIKLYIPTHLPWQ